MSAMLSVTMATLSPKLQDINADVVEITFKTIIKTHFKDEVLTLCYVSNYRHQPLDLNYSLY